MPDRVELPRARLEVFSPGQPSETIPLGMKVKTQRLALILFLVGLFVAVGMRKLTTGDWQPPQRVKIGKTFTEYFAEPFEKYLPPVPVFNEKVDWIFYHCSAMGCVSLVLGGYLHRV